MTAKWRHDAFTIFEDLISTARIRDLIQKGSIDVIPQAIRSGAAESMQLFDQALFKLYQEHQISEFTAYEFADHPTDLKLMISSQEQRTSSLEINLLTDEQAENKED